MNFLPQKATYTSNKSAIIFEVQQFSRAARAILLEEILGK